MSDKFFEDKENMEEENKELEEGKVKVGEKEYDQEELSRLVGLGEIAHEAETKYNVKVDGIWPKFQETINEKLELEKKFKAQEDAKQQEALAQKAQAGEQLSEEEQKRVAVETLRSLAKEAGIPLAEDVRATIRQEEAAKELRFTTENAVNEFTDKYGIQTSAKEVLDYMADPDNPKNPKIALKVMYEEQIDKWKEDKLNGLRPSGYSTIDKSNPGAQKLPPEKIPTNVGEFRAGLKDFFRTRSN